MPGAGRLPQWLLGVGCWRARHAQQAAYIGQIHQASRGTHDALRVHVELAARGLPCGHNRVARLMRQARLVGCHGRRPVHTTRRDPSAKPAPDLVQRTLTAPTPDQLWIADITYIPKEEEGFLYLGVILDVFTRRMVGWSMQEHLRTEHILEALEMAVRHRHPGGGLISSLGSRLPVYLAPVPAAMSGPGDPVFPGIGGRLFGQRHGGEPFRQLGVRTPGPAPVPHPR